MLVEEYAHNGILVEIHQEEENEPFDPRQWSNVGVMFCWHPDYKLGDEQFSPSGREGHTFHRMEDVVTYLMDERKAMVILPLFLLDHSGISMRAGSPILGDPEKDSNQERMKARGVFVGDDQGWDTTHVGFIYTNQEKLDEIGVPPEQAIKALRQEVEVYDQFLTGDIYFYVVDKDEAFEESCGGMFGFEYAKEEANAVAERIMEKYKRESAEAAEWAARDTITI